MLYQKQIQSCGIKGKGTPEQQEVFPGHKVPKYPGGSGRSQRIGEKREGPRFVHQEEKKGGGKLGEEGGSPPLCK